MLLAPGCWSVAVRAWDEIFPFPVKLRARQPGQHRTNTIRQTEKQGIKCSYYLKSPSERRSYHTLIESSVPHYLLADLKFSIKTLHHYLQWMPSISGRQMWYLHFILFVFLILNSWTRSDLTFEDVKDITNQRPASELWTNKKPVSNSELNFMITHYTALRHRHNTQDQQWIRIKPRWRQSALDRLDRQTDIYFLHS